MTIEKVKELLENKLRNLELRRGILFQQGDIDEALESEVEETKQSLEAISRLSSN